MSTIHDRLSLAEGVADEASEYITDLEEALLRIIQWSEAYPLDIFPEPDLKKARELLAVGGITLDAISAHCMRHVIQGVAKIAREVLPQGMTSTPPSPESK